MGRARLIQLMAWWVMNIKAPEPEFTPLMAISVSIP
jgi:hypothetical protein